MPPAEQAIAFDPLPDRTLGDTDFELTAAASSGLEVAFAAEGACSVSGVVVHLTGAGNCSITASQPGNGNFLAAEPVGQSFTISPSPQAISFEPPADRTFGDADVELTAAASSGLPVAFAAEGACTVSGVVLHLTGAGSCSVTATQAGDGNYLAAPPVVRSFAIGRAAQTISFAAPADSTYGDADLLMAATASSGLPVAYAAAGDCSVSGVVLHLTGAGSCSVTATQAGDGNYLAAPPVVRSFAIGRAAQTISFEVPADSTYGGADVVVSATASSGLPVQLTATGPCALTGSTIALTGTGLCTVTAAQPGDDDYRPAESVVHTFAIGRAAQVLTFGELPDATFGDPGVALAGTASSGLPVEYSADGACSVSGDHVDITGAGACSITARQSGNGNYQPAEPVTRTFTVARAGQSISFDEVPDATFGAADFTAAATASSGLPVELSASGSCAVAGQVVHLTGAGSCSLTAAQPGDANHLPALPVVRTFTVQPAGQSISFDPLPNATYGTADFGLTAAASSGLPVRYSAAGVCTLSGVLVHLTAAGVCTITADQDGDADHRPAESVARSFTVVSPILDTFNRSNGGVGSAWTGATTTAFYRISGNALSVLIGGPLVWRASAFGTSQEASVKLTGIDTRNPSQGVLLKVQTGNAPNAGAISVVYDATAQAVRVSTFRLGALTWTAYAGAAATFSPGDRLTGRAFVDGTVQVLRNGTPVSTVTLTAADKAFFNGKGGQIGIWTALATRTVLDDFSGGTLG